MWRNEVERSVIIHKEDFAIASGSDLSIYVLSLENVSLDERVEGHVI